MKTLLILRHAKSSWDAPELADIQRPLNKRGKNDAPRVGEIIKEAGLHSRCHLSSPAVRAVKTAEAAADTCGYEGEIEIRENFYPGSPGDYIEALNEISDGYARVMVVGHNPGLEELLSDLTGEIGGRCQPQRWRKLSWRSSAGSIWTIQVLGKVVEIWRIKELS